VSRKFKKKVHPSLDIVNRNQSFHFAVPSQCVQLKTLAGKPHAGGENKNFDSIVLKILLQMNCKMGGALWKVKIPVSFKRNTNIRKS